MLYDYKSKSLLASATVESIEPMSEPLIITNETVFSIIVFCSVTNATVLIFKDSAAV